MFPISDSTPVVDQGQPIDNSLSHTSTLLEFEDITTNMTSAPNSDPTRNLGTGESGPNLNNLLSILESIRGDTAHPSHRMSTRKTTVSNLSQHPSPSSRPTDRNNLDNQELRFRILYVRKE